MTATMNSAQKIAAIQKSIELQKRTRANIEASRVWVEGVDGLDVDRMLAQCDELILSLECRIGEIERRSEWPSQYGPRGSAANGCFA